MPAIQPGSCVIRSSTTCGTLGFLLRPRNGANERYGVTCHHVLGAIDQAVAAGTAVGDDANASLGAVAADSLPVVTAGIDLALIRVTNGFVSAAVADVGAPTGFVFFADEGMKVWARGAVSGQIIPSTIVEVGVASPFQATGSGGVPVTVSVPGLLRCGLFSKEGDSGGPVLSRSGGIVGMIVGGDGGFTYVAPVALILSHLREKQGLDLEPIWEARDVDLSVGNGSPQPKTMPLLPPAVVKGLMADLGAYTAYRGIVVEVARTLDFAEATAFGIGSRESRWGLANTPPGPAGTGDRAPRNGRLPSDGRGFGRGLMQIDFDAHPFARQPGWEDPRANITFGLQLLRDNLDTVRRRFPSLDEAVTLRAAIASYNCGLGNVVGFLPGRPDEVDGLTTGRDYSADVLRRSAWFEATATR